VDVAAAAAKLDGLIDAKLREEKIAPNPEIDDATFLRRIYLDVVGRIPTIEEAEAFAAASGPDRRSRLIDRLLDSDGYVSHAYNFWADILRINQQLGTGAAQAEAAYQLWLKESLRDNKPYDDMVRELVSARGLIWENGAVGYYQRDRGMPLDNMSNTVRIFLGTRLECAQCHNHPFDKWTQMDYYQMAAFSYGMTANDYDNPNRTALAQRVREERVAIYRSAVGNDALPVFGRVEDMERSIDRDKERGRFEARLAQLGMDEKTFRETALKGIAAVAAFDKRALAMREAETELFRPVRYVGAVEKTKELKLPHDYQYTDAKPFQKVEAKAMFGAEIPVPADGSGSIEAYASWMTSPENPTFTRVIANRMWKKVFGSGIFEPIDEITEQMLVFNKPLLAELEDLMKALDYDLKGYLRILYNTRAYQRAADANEIMLGMPYHFQGPLLRRMSAEQIWDSIVGLALPEADHYRPRLKSQLTSVEKARVIYESLAGCTEDEYFAIVNEVADVIAETRPRQDEVRKALVAARNAEDTETYQAKRKELSELERKVRDAVARIGYSRLEREVGADELLAALGMAEMSMEGAGAAEESEGEREVLLSLPKPNLPEMPEGLDRDQQKAWRARMTSELKTYNALVAGMARASELPSPAPAGHFLREFGQSDREVIENANDAASVPQALNLLNGPIVEALVNPLAVFGRRLQEATTPEEVAGVIFQAMLTRPPTPDEVGIVREELARSPRDGRDGVVWALLNTKQFLFVR
jgi:hypothetical protein